MLSLPSLSIVEFLLCCKALAGLLVLEKSPVPYREDRVAASAIAMRLATVLVGLSLVCVSVIIAQEETDRQVPFRTRALTRQEEEAALALSDSYTLDDGSSTWTASTATGITPDFVSFQRRTRRRSNDRVSVVEIVARIFILRLFEAYLGFSLMIPEVSGNGPFTVLMPWDTPFRELDSALIAKLQNRSWIAHLQSLMGYHIFNGDLPPGDLDARETITMANGEDVVITRTPGTMRM